MLQEKKDEANELLYEVECVYYDAAGVVLKTFPQWKFYENVRSTVLIFGGLVTLYTSSHELMNNQSSPHYTRKGKYTFRRY